MAAAAAHELALRVYFEDTDLSGVVYHANYLRYLERGRSDFLRSLGIDQRAAFEAGAGVYAVTSLAIRYRRPARLGDALCVTSRFRSIAAVRLQLAQEVWRGGELLVEADVAVAFLSPAGRPRRQPAEWLARFRALGPAE